MRKKQKVGDYISIALGMFIIACGIYYIMMPADIVVGSISGLVMVITNFIPMRVSTLTLVINLSLLVASYLLIGKEFAAKSTLATFLLPIFLRIFETITPSASPLTDDIFLDVICYVLVLCFGQALLFRVNACSGGTDIVAKLLNKFFYLDLGKAVMIVGFVIAGSSIFVYDRETVVVSLVGTYISGIALDHFLGEFSIRKKICLLSPKNDIFKEYILKELNRGVTLYPVYGGYSGKKMYEIVTILERSEQAQLAEYVKEIDPKAFMTAYVVGEVSGQWREKMRLSRGKRNGQYEKILDPASAASVGNNPK